ncbi:MAG: cold shock domain-containing protein [Candidatus Poribacteria bacterium]|nr:cold shock domain-containing protein [Candidatus Poribacteria bacterium]
MVNFENFLDTPTRLAVLPDEGRDWRSIGNLTFRAKNEMDQEDMNDYPFYMIKNILSEHPNTSVKLNRDICKSEDWDVEQIREQTRKLGSYFCEIWPDANSFSGKISTRAPKLRTERLPYPPELPDDKFDTKKLYEGVVTNWGSDYSFSYIESNELSWLPHDIEVRPDSLDPSILSRKLHPGLKVKFNIKMIQRDRYLRFQADNVTLFRTEQLYQGEVKWVEPHKRFGFLISGTYPDDIYVSRTQFCSENADPLENGQMLEFNIAETVEGKYSAAINVRPVEP